MVIRFNTGNFKAKSAMKKSSYFSSIAMLYNEISSRVKKIGQIID